MSGENNVKLEDERSIKFVILNGVPTTVQQFFLKENLVLFFLEVKLISSLHVIPSLDVIKDERLAARSSQLGEEHISDL